MGPMRCISPVLKSQQRFSQWLGRNYWYCCGPDRSRNGGEASASVILLKADGGEVVSHPSGWTDGNRMPRGWPLDPDTSVRMGNGQPKTALIFMSKSRTSRHRVSRSLPQKLGPTDRFSSLRWCQGHRILPKSERERRNTVAKARFVFNAGRGCCQLQVMLPSQEGQIGNVGRCFGNIIGNMFGNISSVKNP